MKSNRDYRRKYRQQHPERVKAQNADYYARNRERLKQKRAGGAR